MANNIKNLNYHLPHYLSREAQELFQSIFVLDYKERITVSEILASDWLLDAGKESDEVKDNQSTIFMESIDQMFNYDNF